MSVLVIAEPDRPSLTLAGEKNERNKEIVRSRVKEYMDRAENLKKEMDEQKGGGKKASAMGSDGKSKPAGKG
jgi:vacuolar protein-sorting-associated protein 4